MIRDRAGHVWIAAGSDGLVRVDDRGRASRWASGGEDGRHVSSVFEDRDGNVWVGTDRGIERWRDPVFTSFSTAQGLPAAPIGPVYVDESRTHVVCADERRIVLDPRRRGRPHHRRGPRSRRRVFDSRRRQRRVGRQTARRGHASAAGGELDGRPCGSRRPKGFRRTVSTLWRSPATARSGRAR